MFHNIQITEVCPRDGFQNVKTFIDTEKKLEIAKHLIDAGFRSMEVTSFVSPKWVPQMADAARVLKELKAYRKETGADVELVVLAPNTRGVDNAVAAGAEKIVIPISVIEKHNLSNINRTREQSFQEFTEYAKKYPDVKMCVGLACALGTPYADAPVIEEDIYRMAERVFKLGGAGISLSDTVGNANPEFVDRVTAKLKDYVDIDKVNLHLHDTCALALTNVLVGMKNGLTHVESAAGGLGGCPFAPGAAGNVATEDVLRMFEIMGIESPIKKEPLYRALDCIAGLVDAPIVSHAYSASRCGVHESQSRN